MDRQIGRYHTFVIHFKSSEINQNDTHKTFHQIKQPFYKQLHYHRALKLVKKQSQTIVAKYCPDISSPSGDGGDVKEIN